MALRQLAALLGYLFHDLLLYVIRDVRMILEILLGSITALTQTGIAHGEPRAGFVEDAEFHAEIDQLARAGNAFAVHNIELSLLERGSDLVFYNLYAGVAADHSVPFFRCSTRRTSMRTDA